MPKWSIKAISYGHTDGTTLIILKLRLKNYNILTYNRKKFFYELHSLWLCCKSMFQLIVKQFMKIELDEMQIGKKYT